MRPALCGNPQNGFPRECLFAAREADYDGVVIYAFRFGLIRFGVVEDDAKVIARRQLLEVVPITDGVSVVGGPERDACHE
jgi:hypothetical protein